jgi:hypothetical protein
MASFLVSLTVILMIVLNVVAATAIVVRSLPSSSSR